MTQAPPAILRDPHKIPTTGSRQGRWPSGGAKAGRPAQPGRRGRHRARATRGGGEAISLSTDYRYGPPRRRAAGGRSGTRMERQQCESVSEEKLAARLEKVTERLAADAPNMKGPGAARS